MVNSNKKEGKPIKASEITFFSLLSGKKIQKLCPHLEEKSAFANDVCKTILDDLHLTALSPDYVGKRIVILGDLGTGIVVLARNLTIRLDDQGYQKIEKIDELFGDYDRGKANSLIKDDLFFKHEKHQFQIAKNLDDFQDENARNFLKSAHYVIFVESEGEKREDFKHAIQFLESSPIQQL